MMLSPEHDTRVLPPTHPHTVVIVDDEPSVLAALRRILRREPYDLITTESPLRAVDFVESRDVSLVLADHRMPEMTGMDVLEAVRRCSPGTICAVLTGFPASVLRHPDVKRTVRWVISKPWDDEQLKRTVRHLLRERELGAADDDEEHHEPSN